MNTDLEGDELIESIKNRTKFVFHPLNDHMNYCPLIKYHQFDHITSKYVLKSMANSKLTLGGLINKLKISLDSGNLLILQICAKYFYKNDL